MAAPGKQIPNPQVLLSIAARLKAHAARWKESGEAELTLSRS